MLDPCWMADIQLKTGFLSVLVNIYIYIYLTLEACIISLLTLHPTPSFFLYLKDSSKRLAVFHQPIPLMDNM